MRNPLLIASLAALALATVAHAKKKPELPSPPTISASPIALMIAGFDRDGDARVARAEYDAGVTLSFADGDANKDERITLIELSGWAAKWLGNAGALPGQYDFDRDGDDSISPADYAAEFERRFIALDKDGDGALVRSELILLYAQPPRRERSALPPPPQ